MNRVGLVVALLAASPAHGLLPLVPVRTGAGRMKPASIPDGFGTASQAPLRRARAEDGRSLTRTYADPSGLGPLGSDGLIFLAATVIVVPLTKSVKVSSVLGFLFAGFLLGPAGIGVFKDLNDLESLSEIGILFLLFEQGLELTLDRLRNLAKYAFGLGFLQMLLCTIAFGLFPFMRGVDLLEVVFRSPPDLVGITRPDEALIIGSALSLSSSAFVLKVLQEKGLQNTRTGAASLGILLLQDLAVVPILVLIPIIEAQLSGTGNVLSTAELAQSAAASLGALTLVLGGGSLILRRVFDMIASTRSTDAFVAMSLLVGLGMGKVTSMLGMSDTLGAFAAGALLADTNYKAQVEADIQPFRGLLLGLFFMTTGASVDPTVVAAQVPTFLALLGGLIVFKASIISLTGYRHFDLRKEEAIRVGALLSGGGEFSFVVLALAEKLGVLPSPLAKLLTAVVVASMALTPVLDFAGERLGELARDKNEDAEEFFNVPCGDGCLVSPIVVLGFGPVGQTVVSLFASPELDEWIDGGIPFAAFDRDPARVAESRRLGVPCFYGDGSQQHVLQAAGVDDPRAFVVVHSDFGQRLEAVRRLRDAFPDKPIFSRASLLEQQVQLQAVGATYVVPERDELSLRLGAAVIEEVYGGVNADTLETAKKRLRAELTNRTERVKGFIRASSEEKGAKGGEQLASPYLCIDCDANDPKAMMQLPKPVPEDCSDQVPFTFPIVDKHKTVVDKNASHEEETGAPSLDRQVQEQKKQ
uniref:RCK N-terminal domain-containing protein n=1 Tax=Pinguiococcus pyrenoidosus TaxID=172671 RepID=A0A7R9U8T7_9STRA|mmetsp:Transcript_1947/g.8613  ORF Transcript_1947/g.8613 Transcript_1947/m.8613 type:complete len:756 (+) Transcript_1947:275-2542(+)